jgi:hypothetical protein
MKYQDIECVVDFLCFKYPELSNGFRGMFATGLMVASKIGSSRPSIAYDGKMVACFRTDIDDIFVNFNNVIYRMRPMKDAKTNISRYLDRHRSQNLFRWEFYSQGLPISEYDQFWRERQLDSIGI